MYEQLSKLVDEVPYFKKIVRKYRYKLDIRKRKTKPTPLENLEYVIKDKAWSVLSDYVRIRDYIHYRKCASCDTIFAEWRHSQAGHFKNMAGHGALVGFHEDNVHAQCGKCNLAGGNDVGTVYGDTLRARYGMDFIPKINQLANQSIKADAWYFLDRIKYYHNLIMELKKQYPDYDYPEYAK